MQFLWGKQKLRLIIFIIIFINHILILKTVT